MTNSLVTCPRCGVAVSGYIVAESGHFHYVDNNVDDTKLFDVSNGNIIDSERRD